MAELRVIAQNGFACDSMLHRLCVWLRMSGYHCRYFEKIDDDDLIKHCAKTREILLTGDEELANKAASYCRVLRIHSMDYWQQLKEVVKEFKLKPRFTARFCSNCGAELKKISKKAAKPHVWPFTYKTHSVFWCCAGCKQIYWKGSHWKKIKRKLEKLR